MITEKEKMDFLIMFGKLLAKVRKSKKLSYRKLATLCDTIDHSYISKIEKGETNITLETVAELAKALNIDTKTLFEFEYYKKDA